MDFTYTSSAQLYVNGLVQTCRIINDSGDGIADGSEAVVGGVQRGEWADIERGSVIGGTGGAEIGNAREIEKIGGEDVNTAVGVSVGQGEDVAQFARHKAGFFVQFPPGGGFHGLARINEAAGQVKRASRGLARATHGEDLSVVIQNEAGDGGSDVRKVGEVAMRAVQGAARWVLQVGRAATRAVAEGVQGV